MSQTAEDQYFRISLHPALRRVGKQPEQNRSLLFVDVEANPNDDPEDVLNTLRDMHHRVSPNISTVLVRCPIAAEYATQDSEAEPWVEALKRSTAMLSHTASIGLVTNTIGQDAKITWVSETSEKEDEKLLDRARAVELRYLLNEGSAIWQPSTYHFRLPSGAHSETFIRVGDAIRNPRDARVLASWLNKYILADIGILADSRALTPVVLAFQELQKAHRGEFSPAHFLDDYPRTRLDITMAALESKRSEGLLALQTVSASGNLRSLLWEALRDPPVMHPNNAVHEFISRMNPSASQKAENVHTWLRLPNPSRSINIDGDCNHCRNHSRSRLVHIDPKTLGTVLLPRPHESVPRIQTALDSRGFWTAVDACDALALEVRPHPDSMKARPRTDALNVRILYGSLLPTLETNKPFREELERRTQKLLRVSKTSSLIEAAEACCIIVPKSDLETPGFTQAAKSIWKQVTGKDDWKESELIQWDNHNFDRALPSGQKYLVFVIGMVTGWTLRQILVDIRDKTAGSEAADGSPNQPKEVHGVVFHARPSSEIEWKNLYNSYEYKLHRIWYTPLPWESPLKAEGKSLQLFGEMNNEFVNTRLDFCKSHETQEARRLVVPKSVPLLWGATAGMTVRGESVYGSRLSLETAYASIGSAIQSARDDASTAQPHSWNVFDMGRITRSYYDAAIVAIVLRWLQPEEVWWGNRASDGIDLVDELIQKTDNDTERELLLAELLLAASQGKLPQNCDPLLIGASQNLVKSESCLVVGIRLLEFSRVGIVEANSEGSSLA